MTKLFRMDVTYKSTSSNVGRDHLIREIQYVFKIDTVRVLLHAKHEYTRFQPVASS